MTRSDESGLLFLLDFSQGTQCYYTYIILCSISFIIRFFYKITTLIHIVISEGLNTLPILWWQQTIHMHCVCYSSQSWSVPEYGSAHKLHWQAESQFFFTDALYPLFFSMEEHKSRQDHPKIISTPINLMGNVIKKESIQEGAVWGFTHVTHSKPFRVVKLYLAMYITGHVHTRHSSVASGGRVSATHPKLGEGWAFRLSAVSPATRGQCRGRLCHWFPIWGRQCGRLQWTGGGCFTQAKGGPWTSEFDCCNIQDRKFLCKANVSI